MRLIAKIQKMSDADSISGLRARLVTSDNTLLGTSISDDEGICHFDRNLLNRKNALNASHLLIDSPWRAGQQLHSLISRLFTTLGG